MRFFKSIEQVQRFPSNYSTMYDFFRDDLIQLITSNHLLISGIWFELWQHFALNSSA